MSGEMIYRDSGRKETRYLCKCSCANKDLGKPYIRTDPCDGYILEYNTIHEAREAGWRRTNHIKFCPPDEDYRWVCPDCAKNFDWDLHTKVILDNYKRILNDYSDRRYNGI